MRSWLSQLDFTYTPPPGFDTQNIKDLVAPKSEDHRKGMGLEIAAAASCTTSSWKTNTRRKELPERGGIKKRVPLIPPNKIRELKLARFPPEPKYVLYRPYLLRATDDPATQVKWPKQSHSRSIAR